MEEGCHPCSDVSSLWAVHPLWSGSSTFFARVIDSCPLVLAELAAVSALAKFGAANETQLPSIVVLLER